MRSLVISLFVIFMGMAGGIVNTVNAQYFEDTGTPLIGFTAKQMMNVSEQFPELSPAGFREEAEGLINPSEIPVIGPIVDFAWNTVTVGFKVARFLFDSIINSTLHLHIYLQHFGTEGTPYEIDVVPAYIAVPVAILININHLITLAQLIRGGFADII